MLFDSYVYVLSCKTAGFTPADTILKNLTFSLSVNHLTHRVPLILTPLADTLTILG